MKKPQVLSFIDWYKPFFKAGGPVRSMVNLVDHLGDAIDFHIVTGDRDYTANERPKDLITDEWVVSENREKVWYASPEKRSLSSWRKLLGEQAWDVVYINGLYSTWSTIVPLWLLRGSAQRRIVAIRGMLAAGPMRQSGLKKRAFLAVMKVLGCFKGVEFQATNTDEVADVKRWISTTAKVHLVQNLARKLKATKPETIPKETGKLRLVSFARIAEEKNTLFAIERLGELRGTVHFDLYGTVYDEAYWKRCQAKIATLPQGVEVIWHGQLEQDRVAGVLSGSHVLFMPSVGENFGHTMLEALTSGRPLLISDRTPWKGLEAASAGWDLPLEDPSRYSDVLQELVDMDQTAFDKLAEGAYAVGVRYLTDPEPVQRSLALFDP